MTESTTTTASTTTTEWTTTTESTTTTPTTTTESTTTTEATTTTTEVDTSCDPVEPSTSITSFEAEVRVNTPGFETPDANCPDVGVQRAGTIALVVAEEGNWYHANFDGAFMWVLKNNMQPIPPPVATGTIGGTITANGEAATGVQIALYEANGNPISDPAGKRGDFVSGVSTNNAGRYQFTAPVGCYVVALNAPDGYSWVGAGTIIDVGGCFEAADGSVRVDGILEEVAPPDGTISGKVDLAGAGVEGVKVDSFVTNDAGERLSFVSATTTGAAGEFSFSLPSGCYKLTFVAPDGMSFNGEMFHNSAAVCVDAGASATANATLTQP